MKDATKIVDLELSLAAKILHAWCQNSPLTSPLGCASLTVFTTVAFLHYCLLLSGPLLGLPHGLRALTLSMSCSALRDWAF